MLKKRINEIITRKPYLSRRQILLHGITVLRMDNVEGRSCMKNIHARASMAQPNCTGKGVGERGFDEAWAIFQTCRPFMKSIVEVVQETDMVDGKNNRAPRADFQVELKSRGALRKFLIGSVFRIYSSNPKKVVDEHFVRRLVKKKLRGIYNCIGYLKIYQESDDWFLYRRILYILIPNMEIFNIFARVFHEMLNDFMNVPHLSIIINILPNSTGIFSS